MSNLLAARFSNAPVMVSADKAGWLAECLHSASAELTKLDSRMSAEPVKMQDDFWPAPDSWMRFFRPYEVVAGTLTIPIKGVMLHDMGYQLMGWATGYVYIQKALERGLADGSVQRIALMINSGGGDVAGNFDLVDRIYEARGVKPIVAYVNEHAYSAAYSIASAASKIIVPRTGGVGSIGVLTSHVDASKAFDERGLKVTLIHSGEHKVDGNQFEALPEAVKARIQSRIDTMRALFAATVARNLGVSEEDILATEAQTYGAAEAIELGLAHEIRPIDEALAAFSGELEITAEEDTMELTPEQEQAVQARIDTASAAAKADGQKEGASAERTRIQAILGHADAADRGTLATHLAMGTDMSVDAAAGILAASPKTSVTTTAEKPAGADFDAAMSLNNPGVQAGGNQDNLTLAQETEKEFLAATGYGSAK
jgi:signal peptide peptidase SppA